MTAVLKKIHVDLGITSQMIANHKLLATVEPPLDQLEVVDICFDGKPFLLEKQAAKAWREMRKAASLENTVLDPHSGFRSYLYQKQLIEAGLKKGKALNVILTELAIPGFSEHHSGKAVDICTDNQFVLDQSFEESRAYAWLQKNAESFHFRLSYPRGNNWGIIFEPWHWYFVG